MVAGKDMKPSMNPDDLSEHRFEKALTLKGLITSVVTGGTITDWEYRLIRADFVDDPATKRLLPRYVITSMNTKSLWAAMKAVHTGDGA